MRRRIRFTGRRQIPHSSVEVRVFEVGYGRKVVSLSILHPERFRSFPGDAKLKLRMFENKFVETIEFGTLDAQGLTTPTADLENTAFSAPSCQLRVVVSDGDEKGLLLGSTKTWTLRDNDERAEGSRKGILMFMPQDIAPHTWKLDLRDDDHPIVYIDKNITSPDIWVRSDPVFVSCVLPAIIREVFEDIFLDFDDHSELEWVKDWLRWANDLMPGRALPSPDDSRQKKAWIEDLLASFCRRHSALDRLLEHMKEQSANG